MADTLFEHQHLWKVEEHYDAIRKKTLKAVQEEREWCSKWKRKEPLIFESEGEAVAFMIERAEKGIVSAENDLKKAKERLKKLQKKFQFARG